MEPTKIINNMLLSEAVKRAKEDIAYLDSLPDICKSYSLVEGSIITIGILLPWGAGITTEEGKGPWGIDPIPGKVEVRTEYDPLKLLGLNLYSVVVDARVVDIEVPGRDLRKVAVDLSQRIQSRFYAVGAEERIGIVYIFVREDL